MDTFMTDDELARLYFDRYRLLMLDEAIEVDPFDVLCESEVRAMAGTIRHVLAHAEQADMALTKEEPA